MMSITLEKIDERLMQQPAMDSPYHAPEVKIWVLAAQDIHQKNAASWRCVWRLVKAPRGMAYSERPLANTSA